MNDELIAALERTAAWCEALELCHPSDIYAVVKSRQTGDAATIRAHITDLRAGNLVRREDVVALNGDFACAVAYDSGHIAGAAQERAKVVAWLRKRGDCWSTDDEIADAIASGAHDTSNQSEPNQ